MYETDNGARPPAGPGYRLPEHRPLRDLSLYEDLIADGLAAANSQGGAINHVTARRMALWLVAQQQPPDFTRGLIRFAQSGAVTRSLKLQLADYARSAGLPTPVNGRQAQGIRSRPRHRPRPGRRRFRRHLRPDRPGRRDARRPARTNQARPGTPEAAQPEAPVAQQPLVLARRDPDSRTVTLVLDAATADIAMFAVAAHADEREAHVREVERYGRSLPEDSYGRRNRQDIAAHETRVAARLRAVEQAYRIAIDHDTAYRLPDPTQNVPLC